MGSKKSDSPKKTIAAAAKQPAPPKGKAKASPPAKSNGAAAKAAPRDEDDDDEEVSSSFPPPAGGKANGKTKEQLIKLGKSKGFLTYDDVHEALPGEETGPDQMDDPVDRLNMGMYKEVAALSGDPDRLDWGLRMNVVARQLERVGDHAVDIAEQVGFLLTGEFREFTDASHPVQAVQPTDAD